jgi:four helix bundle protein
MNYEDLDIWKLAQELTVSIHEMTLSDLPKFEMYESGSQIRRSIKSVKANIVEGYGRRWHKNEFLHFLIIAHASNDETIDHLKTLYTTKSLRDEIKYQSLLKKLDELGRKLYHFTNSVRQNHNT